MKKDLANPYYLEKEVEKIEMERDKEGDMLNEGEETPDEQEARDNNPLEPDLKNDQIPIQNTPKTHPSVVDSGRPKRATRRPERLNYE